MNRYIPINEKHRKVLIKSCLSLMENNKKVNDDERKLLVELLYTLYEIRDN